MGNWHMSIEERAGLWYYIDPHNNTLCNNLGDAIQELRLRNPDAQVAIDSIHNEECSKKCKRCRSSGHLDAWTEAVHQASITTPTNNLINQERPVTSE